MAETKLEVAKKKTVKKTTIKPTKLEEDFINLPFRGDKYKLGFNREISLNLQLQIENLQKEHEKEEAEASQMRFGIESNDLLIYYVFEKYHSDLSQDERKEIVYAQKRKQSLLEKIAEMHSNVFSYLIVDGDETEDWEANF